MARQELVSCAPSGAAATERSHSASQLREAASASVDTLFVSFHSGPLGLTTGVAAERLRTVGRNEVAQERHPSWYIQLWHGFANAFSALLAVLSLVSWFTGDRESALIIAAMVLLSGFLRFFQERRASLAAQKLREMVRVTCTVIRQAPSGTSGEREIQIAELVPGDLVKLSAGDMVPADLRLLSAKDLFVAQSALTGEALPVEKMGASITTPGPNPLELGNIVFLGTNVTSGTAVGLVVLTGESTYFGGIAESLAGPRPLTSFERGIRGVSLLLMRFMVVMTVLVFFINGVSKHDWKQAFFFALAVAVGLTPEMLPMILSGTLAIGAVAMSKKRSS